MVMSSPTCLIYVLCPDTASYTTACGVYTNPIFKPITIPQTKWLESIMYVSELMSKESEWKDLDYVGCIAHTAETKRPGLLDGIQTCLDDGHAANHDVIALFGTGAVTNVVANGDMYHPGFTDAWNYAWSLLGHDPQRMSRPCRAFWCNYWCARPSFMRTYCHMLAYFADRLKTSAYTRSVLWRNSLYRGTISREKLLQLFGVPYYPMLPFVVERMICAYASVYANGITFLS